MLATPWMRRKLATPWLRRKWRTRNAIPAIFCSSKGAASSDVIRCTPTLDAVRNVDLGSMLMPKVTAHDCTHRCIICPSRDFSACAGRNRADQEDIACTPAASACAHEAFACPPKASVPGEISVPGEASAPGGAALDCSSDPALPTAPSTKAQLDR